MEKREIIQQSLVNIRSIILIIILCLSSGAIESLPGAGRNGDDSNSENAVKKEADKPGVFKVTLVELGSTRCIPCKKMKPILDEIEKEYMGQVIVVFHDVWTDAGRPYAGKFKIRIIPTQVFLDKNGKEYFRHEGFFPKKELVKILKMRGVK